MQSTLTLKSNIKKKLISDKIVKSIFLTITIFCASIIIFIVGFITIKGISPFVNEYSVDGSLYKVNFLKFILGDTWFVYPNIYSIGVVVLNTIYLVVLSGLIAIPISILTALFIAKIAPKKIGKFLNYVVELLAAVPSIVYGVFGAGVITVMVRNVGDAFGIQTAGGASTIAAVIVMAMMIMPTITMLSITSIKAVKKDLEHGSLALGASKTQTNFKIVLTAAKSGIFSAVILGIGRALGEATAVYMVCGNGSSGFSLNPFDITSTLTSTMLLGLNESVGLGYDIRFSVAIVLILLIIGVNILLNYFKKRMMK
ncbi:MAG: phosphate ABC transporter permease subunit PstC [Anaeroplasmataceae bacterium]